MATFPPPSKIGEEEWDRHKSLIVSLYLGTNHGVVGTGGGPTKGKTLDEVAEAMRGYGFNASVAQFETKLNLWEARKNLKPEEWEQIHERLDMLPRNTKSRVLISGRVVADSKIKRARRYRKQKSRTTNSVHTGGSSNFSALSDHVNIEIQETDGRWIRPFDADAAPALTIPNPPSAVVVGEGSTAGLSVSSLIPVTSTSPRSPLSNNHYSFDSCRIFDESIQEYRLEYPTTWLGSLPSRRIINIMCEYELDSVGIITRNTTQDQAMSTQMIQWDNEMFCSPISDRNLQSPNAITTCHDSRSQNERNRRIMTPADIRRINFSHFLLSAITNGIYEPDAIPEEVLDDFFGPYITVGSLFLHCFKDNPYLFTALVSTLLMALIYRGKREAIAWLLINGLIHADNTVIYSRNGRFTPLEAAAGQRDEALMELFLSHGSNPNKSLCSSHENGALGPIIDSYRLLQSPYRLQVPPTYQVAHRRDNLHKRHFPCRRKDCFQGPPSLNILRKLFEAGANVRPCIFLLDVLDKASVSLVILHINPSEHEEYFERELWSLILQYSEDAQAADLFSRMLFDCAERHNGRCISRYQQEVDNGLIIAALTGCTKTFLAMSPHSSHTSSDLNERLLSAAIHGGQSVIINSAMLRRPNINPLPHHLLLVNYCSSDRTSPLAQAIQTKNNKLTECFANAGIFKSLHMGNRFEVALNAAAEIGDVNLVTRMLSSCPNLDSQKMTPALRLAIEKGHEVIAHLLLEEGASVYSELPGDELTLLAVHKGHKSIARSLLDIGDRKLHSITHHFGELWNLIMDPEITESYLLSFACDFRYGIAANLTDLNYGPKTLAHNYYQYIYDYLAATIRSKRMSDPILDSKLATVQFLTACLAIAVSQKDLTLAQELIKRGANALDETVLICAVQRETISLFQLLLRGVDDQRPVMTRGLRTDVLKAAIKQGPDKYDLVCQLIKSGLVDILDTGNSEFHDEYGKLTPLGLAIRATKAGFPQEFSYDVARLLLDHGCDPNSIVRFYDNSHPPTNQTAMLEAIGVENQELVKLLIEYGADVNPELRYLVRRTPLQKAAENGSLSMVRLLLQHGADVNAKPAIAMGGTALQFAAISGNCEVACELLSHGAFLYMPPPKIGGRWPLEGAAEHGRIEMIQFLWKAKEETLFLGFGDNGFQDKNYKKAMRLARQNHHHVCAELIAKLANLPVTATDIPPVVSPMYVDWPPPERPVD